MPEGAVQSGSAGAKGRSDSSLMWTIVRKGNVDPAAAEYAEKRLTHVSETVREPVLFARVKLCRAADPALPRPSLVEATLDVNGDVVRAHVAAREMREAVDLVERRLLDKLDHRRQHREALRRRGAAPSEGEWSHGAAPAPRPQYFDRPHDERQLIRHKTFALQDLTADEAAFDMEQLDYDFYLFRDADTGQDTLIIRRPGARYTLVRVDGAADPPRPNGADVELVAAPAPRLAVGEAIDRLDEGGEPFVFFRSPTTGRGNVVYRRYDGHYGLLTAA